LESTRHDLKVRETAGGNGSPNDTRRWQERRGKNRQGKATEVGWTVYHRQFEAMANHNEWTSREEATHLLLLLQGLAADILHGVPV
jgi:hypothetical protein